MSTPRGPWTLTQVGDRAATGQDTGDTPAETGRGRGDNHRGSRESEGEEDEGEGQRLRVGPGLLVDGGYSLFNGVWTGRSRPQSEGRGGSVPQKRRAPTHVRPRGVGEPKTSRLEVTGPVLTCSWPGSGGYLSVGRSEASRRLGGGPNPWCRGETVTDPPPDP